MAKRKNIPLEDIIELMLLVRLMLLGFFLVLLVISNVYVMYFSLSFYDSTSVSIRLLYARSFSNSSIQGLPASLFFKMWIYTLF